MLSITSLLILIPLASREVVSGFNFFGNFLDECKSRDEMFKCLKIEAIKVAEKATRLKSLSLIEGMSLVSNGRESKSIRFDVNLTDSELEKLNDGQLDELLKDSAERFLENRQLKVKIPDLVEEGRKKKKKRGSGKAVLYGVLAMKAIFSAMAYKGIAVMSALALMIGKMALLLSAILGLKELVSSGQETTIVEIIQQPKYSESHTHSTSYEDDGGHYRR